ncbi:NHL repeat-containing protein [Geobacter argillaceus]|uniref:hypothetical protein n=1 Tax=Geobacter argillaceus TaxID=345631 RepID=UPI0011A2C76A|nr:hypothetical protein [Geobacter argillaceus]
MKATPIVFCAVLLFLSAVGFGGAESKTNRFSDHGVAVPVSTARGVAATVDGAGRNVVVAWLYDHRGGYALLMIDAKTGRTEQFPLPFPADGDGPFASLLSSRNRFYTQFNGHFVEFDVNKRAFTFWRKTATKTAMSMTEDDKGVIWSATHPQAGIVAYNPATGQLKDYGQVYKQNWEQYPRSIAADDKGWIYLALGFTASQIVAFNPSTGVALPKLPEGERKRGMAYLYRDMDGKVYGKALEQEPTAWDVEQKSFRKALGQDKAGGWYALYNGACVKTGAHEQVRPKEEITGNQNLFHRSFPDGRRLAELDLTERRLAIDDPRRKGYSQKLRFDYSSDGANIMTVSVTPGGAIYGATTFPTQFFSYDPGSSRRERRACYGQWNTVVSQGDKVFVGGYPGGFLLEWDPSRPWQPDKNRSGWNPQYLCAGTPIVNRPSTLLALPDGKTIVMAGTPDYGVTGGGLVFWDSGKREMQLLRDRDIIPDQSTNSLLVLPGNKLLGGTTIAAGTGGEKKARAPELYLMDITTRKLLWRQAVIPSLQEFTDLCQGPQGLVYGMMNRGTFFVFDPASRKLISQETSRFGLTTWHQGPRVFVPGPNQQVYVLFTKGIARIDPKSHKMNWLADSPVPITAGGIYRDGRIYFAGGDSHLYSYRVE